MTPCWLWWISPAFPDPSCKIKALSTFKDPELKRLYGKKITFFGGVGCQRLLPFASPDEVRAEIRKLRREMSKGGGYILSSAKPLNKAVPAANVVAAYEAFTEENEKFLRQL